MEVRKTICSQIFHHLFHLPRDQLPGSCCKGTSQSTTPSQKSAISSKSFRKAESRRFYAQSASFVGWERWKSRRGPKSFLHFGLDVGVHSSPLRNGCSCATIAGMHMDVEFPPHARVMGLSNRTLSSCPKFLKGLVFLVSYTKNSTSVFGRAVQSHNPPRIYVYILTAC
jgi:hypothetical protein